MGATQKSETFTADDLRTFATGVLASLGVPEADAELLSDSLVQAELWGHSSHGMMRLSWYVARLRSGVMEKVTTPIAVTDTGSLVVLDGQHGIGQVLTSRAVDLGVERARTHGISGIAIRNSNHFGTAMYFTRRAAEAGCVALLFTNASPAMAPWGGRHKTIGTNPWSIAAPAGRFGVAALDLANTAVARGKIYLAAENEEPIPHGWAANADGLPTTDPRQALDGILLPMAGPKGYVISFMIDVLAGVLTGSNFGDAVAGPYEPDRRSGVGHLLLTVDVAALSSRKEFAARMEQLIDDTKASDKAVGYDEIYFPGEMEDRAQLDRMANGIPIAANIRASLATLGVETGIRLPKPTMTNEDIS